MKHGTITIETGIPIPPPSQNFNRKPKGPLRLAIEALKQGESFVLRKKDLARAFGAAKNANIESSADTAGVAPRHATDGIPPLSAALCYPLAESTQNTLP